MPTFLIYIFFVLRFRNKHSFFFSLFVCWFFINVLSLRLIYLHSVLWNISIEMTIIFNWFQLNARAQSSHNFACFAICSFRLLVLVDLQTILIMHATVACSIAHSMRNQVRLAIVLVIGPTSLFNYRWVFPISWNLYTFAKNIQRFYSWFLAFSVLCQSKSIDPINLLSDLIDWRCIVQMWWLLIDNKE